MVNSTTPESLFDPLSATAEHAGGLFAQLVMIMARLRSAEGCPWDREQTHATLKKYLIEECYEVCETIDDADWQELAAELGDVLLQVVFHAQIASENNVFNITNTINHINNKLITRHPHVFGSDEERLHSAEEVLEQWEKNKLQRESGRKSLLDGIPVALPALLRAHRMQSRAARVGFDWGSASEVLEKIEEELDEVKSDLHAQRNKELKGELGDLLFAVVNLLRFLEFDPEEALQSTNHKFMKRFQFIEQTLSERGQDIHSASLAEMDMLWEQAKQLPLDEGTVT